MISPDDFIPIAERTGLILAIGAWVIREAFRQLALWQAVPERSDWIMAINISVKQFHQSDFVDKVRRAVDESGIDPRYVKLEITESVFAQDLKRVAEKMRQLKELGIQIALDDFGTGYSSLQYLTRLPIDQVKIDRSFVNNLGASRSDIAIIKSVLLLAEALEIEVMAEGVETQKQYDLLRELKCSLFQGYFFARPQRAGDV
jgi:EAL domain-containing protein (putative c-di-GMP-specific phosphodiesterase class I)